MHEKSQDLLLMIYNSNFIRMNRFAPARHYEYRLRLDVMKIYSVI